MTITAGNGGAVRIKGDLEVDGDCKCTSNPGLTTLALELNRSNANLKAISSELVGSKSDQMALELKINRSDADMEVLTSELSDLKAVVAALFVCAEPNDVDISVRITDGNRDATKGPFGVTVRCADGYEGSPTVTPCAKTGPFDRSPYSYTTCEPIVCSRPPAGQSDGSVVITEGNLNLADGEFDVVVECAAGYEGNPSVAACSTSGQYTYTGCADIDECGSNPCGDFATCSAPEVDSFLCTCDDWYEGGGVEVTADCNEKADPTPFEGKGCNVHFGGEMTFNPTKVAGYTACSNRWNHQFELEQASGTSAKATDWCGGGGFNGDSHLVFEQGAGITLAVDFPADGWYAITER
jgi:hypothetical protein